MAIHGHDLSVVYFILYCDCRPRARADDAPVREVGVVGNTKITAYYNNTRADKLGSELFSCQDYYPQQVADSVLRSGPLPGFLELKMRESISASAGCAGQ